MSYHHLTTYERGCIEVLHKIGYNPREIAKELGRHHSAIELMIFLCKRFPKIVTRNKIIIENLKCNKSIIETGSSVISNLKESALRFSTLLLLSCFDDEIWLQMIEIIPYTVE